MSDILTMQVKQIRRLYMATFAHISKYILNSESKECMDYLTWADISNFNVTCLAVSRFGGVWKSDIFRHILKNTFAKIPQNSTAYGIFTVGLPQ